MAAAPVYLEFRNEHSWVFSRHVYFCYKVHAAAAPVAAAVAAAADALAHLVVV